MEPQGYAMTQQQIHDRRQRHLHEIEHITLAYQDVLDAPERTITRLAPIWSSMSPTPNCKPQSM